MRKIKLLIKKLLPDIIVKIIKDPLFYRKQKKLLFEIESVRSKQETALGAVKQKEYVNVAFLVMHHSIWKYEKVFKLFERDKRYKTSVVIIPLVRDGKADMENYFKTLNYFRNRNYETVETFNMQENSWLDVKVLLNLDVVFFTNPHKITYDIYYIDNFLDKLTCYVPYSFQVANAYESHFNKPFHLKIWKQFYETEFHKKLAAKYSLINGENVVVTGYPIVDYVYDEDINLEDPWPSKDPALKRIIWAPHHTIEGFGEGLDYSTFLNYSNKILQYAKVHSDKLQMAFKPHPLLREKLYKRADWGKEKTDEFYMEWELLDTTILQEGEYIALFKFSDALLHDCGSFSAEYLLFNKPVMFLVANEKSLNNFNDFGKECIARHYIGYSWTVIELFLDSIINSKQDLLANNRREFVKQNCLPPNNKSAAENIFKYLKKQLD